MAAPNSKHVITANRLMDGLVVYLTEDGSWSEVINEARIAADDEALQAALADGQAAEAAHEVVGVYEVAVERDGTDIRPVRIRERIRAYGPTTHTDFSRADVPAHFTHPDGVEPVVFKRA